jgi:long-chain-fatty-acid--CoA ligase ACSBG
MTKQLALREASEYYVSEPSKAVKIFQNPKDKTSSVDPITVPALMNRTVENYGNHPALMHKDPVTNKWVAITYREYKERVEHMAKVFIKLGLERHGSVAVLAFNSVEWFVSELAAIHAGYVVKLEKNLKIKKIILI